MFLITIFIQPHLLTHSTNTVHAAVVEFSLCSSGNEFFILGLRALLFSMGKNRINVGLHMVRAVLWFWMHEIVLRIRAAVMEKQLEIVADQKMVW